MDVIPVVLLFGFYNNKQTNKQNSMIQRQNQPSLINNQTIQHQSPPPPRLHATTPLITSLHLYCVRSIPGGLTANNLVEACLMESPPTAQSISVYPFTIVSDDLQSVDKPPAFKHTSLLWGGSSAGCHSSAGCPSQSSAATKGSVMWREEGWQTVGRRMLQL